VSVDFQELFEFSPSGGILIDLSNFIWNIADLLRGPYRPPQYERVMLPLTVLRRFDCVLAESKEKVLKEYERYNSMFKFSILDMPVFSSSQHGTMS